MLKLQNVSKSFDGFLALDDLTLNVPQGAVYGLVGPNGAGKTTAIRHITGVYRPDSGSVTLAGEPVFENPEAKAKIGYIPDDIFYYPAATLEDMRRFYRDIYPTFDDALFERLREIFPLPEKSPYLIAMENVERVIGRPLDAVISTELGGENTACAFYTAAMTDRIIMDGDPAGRSVPCLQHSTYYLDGIPMCPMAVTNDFGESAVFTHVADDTRGEDLVRALAAVSRNEIMVVDHVNTAAVLEKSVILGAISDAEKLGIAYREALAKGEDCVEAILRAGKGRRVFDGSIVAAEYETVDGYTYGSMRIANGEQQLEIRYQNENIVAILNGEILVTVPDLIIVMDKDAKYPVLNPYARVGMNVSVLCLPAPAVWTSEKGLAVFGPRFFGYDVEWRPFCQ